VDGTSILDTGALLVMPISMISGGSALDSQRIELRRLDPERMEMIDLLVKWVEPGEESIYRAREIARESGDLAGLSEVDLGLLALAIELEKPLLTDDYRLQNLCGIAEIECSPIETEGIASIWSWEIRCLACGKTYPQPSETTPKREGVGECSDCGSPLKLRKRP